MPLKTLIRRAFRKPICALLASASFSVCHANASTITLEPSTQVLAEGGVITVNLDISNINDLYGFEFDLEFNPALLSVLSISEGTFLQTGAPTYFIPGTIDNANGLISATADTLIGAISGVNGSGLLASIQFTALKQGTSSIDIANLILLNSSSALISADIINASATIGASSSPEPAPWQFICPLSLILLLGHKHQSVSHFLLRRNLVSIKTKIT